MGEAACPIIELPARRNPKIIGSCSSSNALLGWCSLPLDLSALLSVLGARKEEAEL